MRKTHKFLSLAACLAVTAAGVPAHAEEQGVTKDEVVVGAHTNESGNFAMFAVFPRIITAYFDRVNAQGGVNGRKIKFIRIDTQNEHMKAVQATKKLVEQDKVFAMVAAQGTAHQPVYKYLMEKGVPDLFFPDALMEYGNPPKKGVLSGNFAFKVEGAAFGTEIVNSHKGKKACFLVQDNAMGEEYLAGATEAIKAGNEKLSDAEKVKIGVAEKAERTATQANTQVLNLKKDGCEVVFTSTYAGLAPSAISFGVAQGFKPAWLVMNWNVSPKFMELIPAEVREGIVSSTQTAVTEEFGTKGYKDAVALAEKNGITVTRGTINGYATAEMFVETLKKAGKNLTRASLLKAVEDMNGYKCSVCLLPMATKNSGFIFEKPVLLVSKGGKWVAKN